MSNNWLADMRTWAVCLIAYCAACTSAVACVAGTQHQRGILFEHVPTDIDAPVVIEATIYDATDNVSFAYDRTFVPVTLMKARVHRVIKGSIDTKYLKIFVYMDSCSHVGVGRGIVLGTLRDDLQRGMMLQAIQKADTRDWSKEFFAKQVAIRDAQSASKTSSGPLSAASPVLVRNQLSPDIRSGSAYGPKAKSGLAL